MSAPMHWIALLPPEGQTALWRLHALRFTPHVAEVVPWMDGSSQAVLLLEVAGSERLFGGRRALLRHLLRPQADRLRALSRIRWQQAASAQVAMGLLRCQCLGLPRPNQVPDGLPLQALGAANEDAATLARMGCRNWGHLRALPREGVARRFGAGLLEAIDQAWGLRPETHTWLRLPERFDERMELPFVSDGLGGLDSTLAHLLALLRLWLMARQRGVLRLQLHWAHDQKRLNGMVLPSQGCLELGTAQATQDVTYLRRLLDEHLSRTGLAAPVRSLRLRALETAPWAAVARSLLPEDIRPGEPLHQLMERLSARLGAHRVRRLQPLADHRPERRQTWSEAQAGAEPGSVGRSEVFLPEALYPTWLLPEPLPLPVLNNVPQHGGPLWRMARLHRVETAWWEEVAGQAGPTRRDYYIARSLVHGWVWIYRERFQWFLQGCYA